MGQNHYITLLSFIFHQKIPLFDVDLFSWTFDLELPLNVCHILLGYHNIGTFFWSFEECSDQGYVREQGDEGAE